MFSFRRRSSRKGEENGAPIRSRPSLPELHSQGIPWPESLVDVASIRQTPPPEHPHQGAAKISFPGATTIPFHKPFRGSSDHPTDGGPISSLYMHPPSAFNKLRASLQTATGRPSQRRARLPPTFNLMVVGGQGTGKTSLLRLLLETADLSPTATVDQRAAMERFLRGKPKLTQSIQTACVEICESRYDRVLFSVVDTPGLDFIEGRELKLERQVSTVLKYVDSQFQDTMSEESKVIRQSKGDQHIHLCIYMVDPSSIMNASARRTQSSLPIRTRSETTISYRPPDLVPDNSSDDSDDEEEERLTMSPAEIRVIRRLSARANVLPVIAHADSLTDEKLAAVKDTVRRDLSEAGLDFGVFGPAAPKAEESPKKPSGNGFQYVNGNGVDTDSEEEDEVEERQARPVVKLRPSQHSSTRPSRSRSRRNLSETTKDDPDWTDKESVASVRFSAHIVAKTDLTAVLPFALIAPEEVNKRRHTSKHPRPLSTASDISSRASMDLSSTDDGRATSVATSPVSASGPSIKNFAYLQGPPEDLKGVFTRKFRWGTVDVLDPSHCDFAALRTAVLSTHLKILKTHTKEVLYEKYRTEKLLARRATHNITKDETKKLFEELGL